MIQSHTHVRAGGPLERRPLASTTYNHRCNGKVNTDERTRVETAAYAPHQWHRRRGKTQSCTAYHRSPWVHLKNGAQQLWRQRRQRVCSIHALSCAPARAAHTNTTAAARSVGHICHVKYFGASASGISKSIHKSSFAIVATTNRHPRSLLPLLRGHSQNLQTSLNRSLNQR